MNGHLQLSISLKNQNEIQAAIDLLQSLLPQAPLNKPFPKKTGFYAVATKGDLVKLSTRPVVKGAKYNKNPAWVESIDTSLDKKSKLKQKQRAAALKRKRDTHGHFLKEKK